MKKVLLVAVAFAATFAFVSCKKCVTCSYEYDYAPTGKISVPYPQECGTAKQIKTYKDNVEADANRHGVTSTCTND
ncbi:MAG: hypothetical protein WCL06_02945 [Bacteroidota bacterium]